MRARKILLIPVCLLMLAAATPVLAPSEVREQPEDLCVTVVNEARYRNYGYDHVVHLKNDCEEAITCSITTGPSLVSSATRTVAGLGADASAGEAAEGICA